MNNNFNNMNRQNIPGMPPGLLAGGRTNSGFKFLIAMLLGILPLLLCAMFITDESMANEFKQWGAQGNTTATTYVDYGFMWLIGIVIYIAIFPVIYFLTKVTNEIKLDVIPSTSAAALAMLNMFVIPHSHAAFLILSLPAFAIIGYIAGAFVMVILMIKTLQSQVKKAQNDPEFKNMMQQMQQQMQGQQPGFNNRPPQKKVNKEDYKDNPYVDIPEEEEDKEK